MANYAKMGTNGPLPRYARTTSDAPGTWEVFTLMSWSDKRMAAFSQAGLVEKFIDALVWVFWPIYLFQQGLSLPNVGWVIGIYGIVKLNIML